ncbi:cytochrome c3 family protein [Thiococcus pfennigii]|uniref:cytochrome c3 family protein n=1 Tax=Thiococcus pfennigii TaxID=1057 RepID=UPI001908C9E1|nr:cytochrome c3 family protein [Thiococcus pfennigii]MBK1730204.1 nitrate reductase [Thiococcus pfennigii]
MSVLPHPSVSSSRRAALLLLLVAVLLAVPPAFGAAERPGALRECQRCHGMATLGYRDPQTWAIVDLFVDPVRFAESAHRELVCVDCHAEDYRGYPHPQVATERKGCTDCHRKNEAVHAQLARIAAELAASVHGKADPDAADARPLDCSSCHDPHDFRPAGCDEPLAAIVHRHNAICFACHQDRPAVLGGTDVALPPHAWLPDREAHWQAVRCVECHTPTAAPASHLVQPAAVAARDCVGCHSRSAELLGDLYAYRSEEEIARRGWLSRAVFNEAYVVGLSRSPTIDRLSLIGLAVVAGLLAAHGLGRWLAARARRRRA